MHRTQLDGIDIICVVEPLFGISFNIGILVQCLNSLTSICLCLLPGLLQFFYFFFFISPSNDDDPLCTV